MEPIAYDSLVYILSFTTEVERLNARLVCVDWHETIDSMTKIGDPTTLLTKRNILSYIKTINTSYAELFEKNIIINVVELLNEFCMNGSFGLIKLSLDKFISNYSLANNRIFDCIRNIIGFKSVSYPRTSTIKKCYYKTPTPKKVEMLRWFAQRGYHDYHLTPYHAAILNNIDLIDAIRPNNYDDDNIFAALKIAINNKNIKMVKSIIRLPKFELSFADFLVIYEKSKAVGKMIIDETDIENTYKIYKTEKIKIPELYNYFRQKLKPILDEEAAMMEEWEKFRINFAKIESSVRKHSAKRDSYQYCIEADISKCIIDRTDLKYAEFYKSYHETHFTMLSCDKINWSKYTWSKDIESFNKIKVHLTLHSV